MFTRTDELPVAILVGEQDGKMASMRIAVGVAAGNYDILQSSVQALFAETEAEGGSRP